MPAHRLSSRRARNLRQRLLARDGNLCTVCKQPFDPTLDGTGKPGAISIKRVMNGGAHAFDNLCLTHRACEPDRTTLPLASRYARTDTRLYRSTSACGAANWQS